MAKKIPETIRITPEIWEALKAKAQPFETPADVLGRILGLEDSPPSRAASPRNGVTRNSVVLNTLDGSTAQQPVTKGAIEAELKKTFPDANVDWCISNLRRTVRRDGGDVVKGPNGYWLKRAT